MIGIENRQGEKTHVVSGVQPTLIEQPPRRRVGRVFEVVGRELFRNPMPAFRHNRNSKPRDVRLTELWMPERNHGRRTGAVRQLQVAPTETFQPGPLQRGAPLNRGRGLVDELVLSLVDLNIIAVLLNGHVLVLLLTFFVTGARTGPTHRVNLHQYLAG